MEELQQQIIKWAESKGIDNPKNQRLKVIEELGEVAGAILRGNRDEILMEIGDVAVTIIILQRILRVDTELPKKPERSRAYSWETPYDTLAWLARYADEEDVLLDAVGLAHHFDSNLEECLTMAWNKIKDRQGKTVDGTFIKNE